VVQYLVAGQRAGREVRLDGVQGCLEHLLVSDLTAHQEVERVLQTGIVAVLDEPFIGDQPRF